MKTINIGSSINAKDGDPLRIAFEKVNDNFTEVYTALGLGDQSLNLGAFEFAGSTLTTTDSSAITIDQAVTINSRLTMSDSIVPDADSVHDLGTPSLQWRSIYVSGNTLHIGGTTLSVSNGELLVGGLPVSSSIDYNNLLNKPTIPTVPTDISQLADATNLLFDGTYASLSGSPTALSDFSNDLDYAAIVGGAIQTNGLPSGTEVTDGIFAKQGQPLSIGYKDLGGSNTSIFVDETTGVQFFKDVTFDNVTVDFTTSSIVNTPFAETSNLATVATSGDYDDLTNKPTDLVRTTMTGSLDANSFDIVNLFAITLQTQTSAILGPPEGTVAIADGVGWDPLGNGRKSMVVYLGGAWREIAAVPGV